MGHWILILDRKPCFLLKFGGRFKWDIGSKALEFVAQVYVRTHRNTRQTKERKSFKLRLFRND